MPLKLVAYKQDAYVYNQIRTAALRYGTNLTNWANSTVVDLSQYITNDDDNEFHIVRKSTDYTPLADKAGYFVFVMDSGYIITEFITQSTMTGQNANTYKAVWVDSKEENIISSGIVARGFDRVYTDNLSKNTHIKKCFVVYNNTGSPYNLIIGGVKPSVDVFLHG